MKALPLTLGAGALTAAALLLAPPSPPTCHLQVIPDYTFGITYKAVLRLSPVCAPTTVLRVRKSSTLSVRRNGAPYQPIRPEVGAWEVAGAWAQAGAPVPDRQLWTLNRPRWRWEWWDELAPNRLTGKPGRWVAGEVLRAAP